MDKLALENALQALQKKQVILYPTDTVWGIGCDATNEQAVSKVYQIKQRAASKSLIILVDSIKMLQNYVQKIPAQALTLLASNTRPTTIIYKNPQRLAKNMIANDDTIAIRIVQDGFCKELIQEFGKPIVSTSANVSGEATPKSFSEISRTILESVDYIVNLQLEHQCDMPSRILKITDLGTIEVIRE